MGMFSLSSDSATEIRVTPRRVKRYRRVHRSFTERVSRPSFAMIAACTSPDSTSVSNLAVPGQFRLLTEAIALIERAYKTHRGTAWHLKSVARIVNRKRGTC